MSIVKDEINRLSKEYVSKLSREELADFLLGNWNQTINLLEAKVKDCLMNRTDILPTEEMKRIALEILFHNSYHLCKRRCDFS